VTVYVDDWRQRATVGPVTDRWSHLTADTTAELHHFAAALGLRKSWFQAHPRDPLRDHYDVTDGVRHRAIALGAVPVTWRQAARARRHRREASGPGASAKPDAPGPSRRPGPLPVPGYAHDDGVHPCGEAAHP
jgi:hypothetical protein